MKGLDMAAIGTCYVDINATGFPFGSEGIAAGVESVGAGYELVAGGSAVNFCRKLGGMGLTTAFVGTCGNDAMATQLSAALEAERVQAFLARNPAVQTNVSFNMTSQTGQHVMGVAGTANAALRFATIATELERAVAEARFLYVGGCFKLVSLSPSFDKLAALAKANGAALVVDHGRLPANISPDMLDKVKSLVLAADYYFPSRDEFCGLWDVDTIEGGLKHLSQVAPDLRVAVKDGSNGAYYANNNGVQHVLAHKVPSVRDVTGAGDAFNAGVIKAISARRALPQAVQYGHDVAAAHISGSAVPSLDV